jgi:hypothetical protein
LTGMNLFLSVSPVFSSLLFMFRREKKERKWNQ